MVGLRRRHAQDVPCTPGQEHYRPVADAFSENPVVLHTMTYGGSFIGLTCRNFSLDKSGKPVPVISGHKYHNGVRDAGEPGLAG